MNPSDLITVRIDKPVHGGHALARHEGRVVFVRHGAPGELVRARVTETKKIWRADAVEILEPHPQRIPVAWEHAGPGGVGAELAHLALPAQREWKVAVITDALERIGGLDLPVTVHAVDDTDGWGTRTRIEVSTDAKGRAGMYAHRSHRHIPLAQMPLAVDEIDALELFTRRWPARTRLSAVAPSADAPIVLIDGEVPPGHPGRVWEQVGDYEFQVAAGGFWQVHRRAPEALLQAVQAGAGQIEGATVVDLFAGAGLFSVPLADMVGTGGRVHAIEGNRRAHLTAQDNAGGRSHLHLHHGDVAAVLGGGEVPRRADVVVLDPPRVGARAEVMEQIIARKPERIVYVSCDPAALARDLATASHGGYETDEVHGYDLFPHTHHIETVVVLTPGH